MMAAPCAQFDDEWQDFNEFKTISDQGIRINRAKLTVDEVTGILEDLPEFNNSFSGEVGSFKSMADLVNGFDEKLTICFQNFNTNRDSIYPLPVNLISEDTVMGSDEIWTALTDNYGSVMPVDWKQSRTRSLHLPTLNLEVNPRRPAIEAELSDDEELREQMDTHSIIVSSINDEPLFTAEQVIEEIEEMMQESPDLEAERNCSQSDLSLAQCCTAGQSYEQRVRTLCVAELNELLEEVETTIRSLSEELVQNLALRDELDFEKEVKNSFISVLIDVQNRQKEHRELMRKRRKTKGRAGSMPGRAERFGSRFSMEGLSTAIQNGFRQTFRSGGSERQYLTTVIPYEKKGVPPSVEDLQTLTKILHAMKDDSDKVPSLLTDYILKVLCPT